MSALYIIVSAAFVVLSSFVCMFVWCVKNRQFDDLDTPAQRILLEDIHERSRT